MIYSVPDRHRIVYNSTSPVVYVYIRNLFVCAAMLLLVASCRDNPTIRTQGLNGKWEIYSALRNGNETPYLRGGYFVFDAKGNLTVNITGEDETGPFSIEGDIISVKDKAKYRVQSLRNDSMDIHFVASPESEFLFFLKKATNENH